MLNLSELRKHLQENPALHTLSTEAAMQLIGIAEAAKRGMVQCAVFNDSEIFMADGEYEIENAKLEKLRKRVRVLLEDVEIGDE